MKYDGGCLCGKTTYTVIGEPLNPHLCSCTMCQKSSGAPTVAWVEFPLNAFQWTGLQPGLFQSSEKTTRCFCQECGGLLGTLNEGHSNVCITIASLNNPNLIAPNEKHSYKNSSPDWWSPHVVNQKENKGLCPQTIAVLFRRLKPDSHYEDFYSAWLPPDSQEKDPRQEALEYYDIPVQAINAVDVNNASDVISIALIYASPESVFENAKKFAETDARRGDKIDKVCERESQAKVYRIQDINELGSKR